MKLDLLPYGEWVRDATLVRPVTGVPPFKLSAGEGSVIRIRPQISEHENLTILGGEWLPVTSAGATTFDWMVHTPSLFPRKSKILVSSGDEWHMPAMTLREHDRPLLLVGGHTNYYHWLIDYLPRLLFAETLEEYDGWQLVVNANLAAHQLQSIELLDIAPERLVRVEAHEAIRAPRVAVPTFASNSSACHPIVPRMLKQAFPPTTKASGRRIYLSREDAATRRIVNEVALMEVLQDFGFEKYVTGRMSFQEQIDLFASASAVVAPHGAGLTNLVFAPAGTAVFEIASPFSRVTFMVLIAHLCQQPHQFIDAQIATSVSPNPAHNDWAADLVQMEIALAGWEASQAL